MTHMDTTYTLSITNQNPVDNSGTAITINSNMPEELVRLLQLSGQNCLYTLNVTQKQHDHASQMRMDSNTCTNLVTTNPDDLIDILMPKSCGCDHDCDCQPAQDYAVMEQQAEYDYGQQDPEDDAHEFDIKDYNFKGRADLPERLTSARYGSNALRSEMREHKSYIHLLSLYKQFLAENTTNGGQTSPLTSDNRNEFLHDPLSDETPVTDGSRSPLSRIKRQKMPD